MKWSLQDKPLILRDLRGAFCSAPKLLSPAYVRLDEWTSTNEGGCNEETFQRTSALEETIAILSGSQLSGVAGGVRLEPSSGTEWSQQGVCPSMCYSDCAGCRPRV